MTRIAMHTLDAVNQQRAAETAQAAGCQLVPVDARDNLPAIAPDALVVDLDSLGFYGEPLGVLAMQQCPVEAVFSRRPLDEVQELLPPTVSVHRSLDEALHHVLARLGQAAPKGRRAA